MKRICSVTNAAGLVFHVTLILNGERYGITNKEHPDGVVIHTERDPLVEFYDSRYPHTPNGQFVSRYYLSTLQAHRGGGLDLDGGVRDWEIDEANVREAVGAAYSAIGYEVVRVRLRCMRVQNADVVAAVPPGKTTTEVVELLGAIYEKYDGASWKMDDDYCEPGLHWVDQRHAVLQPGEGVDLVLQDGAPADAALLALLALPQQELDERVAEAKAQEVKALHKQGRAAQARYLRELE